MAFDEDIIVTGRWFLEHQNMSSPARLRLGKGAAWVEDAHGSVLANAPSTDLKVSSRLAGVSRKVSFPGVGMFETEEDEPLDRWLREQGYWRSGLLASVERFRPKLVLILAAAIVALLSLYRWGLPIAVQIATEFTPTSWEGALSQAALESIDRLFLSESTLPAERVEGLISQARPLFALGERGEAGYTLLFRAGGDIGPNAFALPDGTIVVTDELIALSDGDDEVILGVLGHEIGHVDKRHALERLYYAAGLSGLVMLVGGDIGAAAQELLTHGAAVANLTYSRGQEAQADYYSVLLMGRLGRDPAAVGRFFETLLTTYRNEGEKAIEGGILSTHPGTAERLEDIYRWARQPPSTSSADR